jgi:hypothetical protein
MSAIACGFQPPFRGRLLVRNAVLLLCFGRGCLTARGFDLFTMRSRRGYSRRGFVHASARRKGGASYVLPAFFGNQFFCNKPGSRLLGGGIVGSA